HRAFLPPCCCWMAPPFPTSAVCYRARAWSYPRFPWPALGRACSARALPALGPVLVPGRQACGVRPDRLIEPFEVGFEQGVEPVVGSPLRGALALKLHADESFGIEPEEQH